MPAAGSASRAAVLTVELPARRSAMVVDLLTTATAHRMVVAAADTRPAAAPAAPARCSAPRARAAARRLRRSEEHTSELQSQSNLVCRLLLEKKKKRRRRSLAERARPRSDQSHAIRTS